MRKHLRAVCQQWRHTLSDSTTNPPDLTPEPTIANAAYLVFTGTATEHFQGASLDFFEACRLALACKSASIAVFQNLALTVIANVWDAGSWYFKDQSPYLPFKFTVGTAVKYKLGDQTRVGNIERRRVVANHKESPPFDFETGFAHIEYTVNDAYVDERNLTRIEDL